MKPIVFGRCRASRAASPRHTIAIRAEGAALGIASVHAGTPRLARGAELGQRSDGGCLRQPLWYAIGFFPRLTIPSVGRCRIGESDLPLQHLPNGDRAMPKLRDDCSRTSLTAAPTRAEHRRDPQGLNRQTLVRQRERCDGPQGHIRLYRSDRRRRSPTAPRGGAGARAPRASVRGPPVARGDPGSAAAGRGPSIRRPAPRGCPRPGSSPGCRRKGWLPALARPANSRSPISSSNGSVPRSSRIRSPATGIDSGRRWRQADRDADRGRSRGSRSDLR